PSRAVRAERERLGLDHREVAVGRADLAQLALEHVERGADVLLRGHGRALVAIAPLLHTEHLEGGAEDEGAHDDDHEQLHHREAGRRAAAGDHGLTMVKENVSWATAPCRAAPGIVRVALL